MTRPSRRSRSCVGLMAHPDASSAPPAFNNGRVEPGATGFADTATTDRLTREPA